MTDDILVTYEAISRNLKRFIKKAPLKKEVVDHICKGLSILEFKVGYERYKVNAPNIAQDLLHKTLAKEYDLFFSHLPLESIEDRENISMTIIAKSIEMAIEHNDLYFGGNMLS